MECRIGFTPQPKSSKDRVQQFLQLRKVSIVCAETPRQLPNPFDRIEVGTVGRQEEELGAGGADGVANGSPLVAAEIVHHDDVA